MAMGRSRGCSTSTNCITLWALPMPERVHASTRVKAVPPFQRLKAWRKLETSPLPRREAVSIRGRPPVNVINLSCSPAQGKPPEAASRHGRRAMTRPLPLNQAV